MSEIVDLPSEVLQLTDEELLAEVIRLKNKIETNEQTIAGKRQLVNEKKREHEKQQRLLDDATCELERQQKKKQTLTKQKDEILDLQQQLEDTTQRNNVEFEELQQISAQTMHEMEKLQEDMDKIEDDVDAQQCTRVDDEAYQKHVLLKNEYDSTQEEFDKVRQRMSVISNEKQACADELIKIQRELNEYEEKNTSVETSLHEERALVETLGAELAMLNIELQTLQKTKSTNSLFNEVDERRIVMQDEVTRLKTEYGKMKDERNQLSRTLGHQKMENAKLRYMCDDSLKERDMDLLHLELANRDGINTLRNVLSQLTDLQKLRIALSEGSSKSQDFNTLFGNVSKLTEKINEYQALLNNEEHANYTALRTIQQCKSDIDKLKTKAAVMEEANKNIQNLIENVKKIDGKQAKCVCTVEMNANKPL